MTELTPSLQPTSTPSARTVALSVTATMVGASIGAGFAIAAEAAFTAMSLPLTLKGTIFVAAAIIGYCIGRGLRHEARRSSRRVLHVQLVALGAIGLVVTRFLGFLWTQSTAGSLGDGSVVTRFIDALAHHWAPGELRWIADIAFVFIVFAIASRVMKLDPRESSSST